MAAHHERAIWMHRVVTTRQINPRLRVDCVLPSRFHGWILADRRDPGTKVLAGRPALQPGATRTATRTAHSGAAAKRDPPGEAQETGLMPRGVQGGHSE